MGLIKAAVSSVSGTLSDQWEDLIKCEDMGNDTLMVKKTTKSGQISKNSRIIVAPGQVAVIYDSGSVLDGLMSVKMTNKLSNKSPSCLKVPSNIN